MLFAAPASQAALVTLIDENSVVNFDTESQLGMYDWIVDGQDVLKKQWFWYRTDNNPEQSIDTIPQTAVGTSDTDFDGDPDVLFVRYTVAGTFQIETKYTLDGGALGSGVSDIGEQISITNLTADPGGPAAQALDFHFFQYVDLDLSAGSDFASYPNVNTVQQVGDFGNVSETVNTPQASHREANFFPVTLGKLNDGAPTTLNDVLAAGPGDVTWAYQWDASIPATGVGKTYAISKDKQVLIPEPGSMTLLAGAAAAAMLRRRRRTA